MKEFTIFQFIHRRAVKFVAGCWNETGYVLNTALRADSLPERSGWKISCMDGINWNYTLVVILLENKSIGFFVNSETHYSVLLGFVLWF